MLKLYGGARSRASIVQWYLEELALPYQFVQLDMQAGAHRQPDYLAINPMGKVPALVDGDFTLWESGAILLYLAEQYGGVAGAQERALLAQWISFANATLAPEIFSEVTREASTPRLLGGLSQVLTSQTYLVGDSFSVADVAVGSVLAYFIVLLKLDISAYPAIASYMQRLGTRPAFQKTIGARST